MSLVDHCSGSSLHAALLPHLDRGLHAPSNRRPRWCRVRTVLTNVMEAALPAKQERQCYDAVSKHPISVQPCVRTPPQA